MVLRRCHFIVVSDAGEDPECSFADLGEAVRKIRVDFGIPIDFDQMNIIRAAKSPQRCSMAIAALLAAFDIQQSTDPPLLTASSFTLSRRVTVMNRGTFTNTLRGAKHFRTRAPVISFSPSRNLRATECSVHTRWRNSARMAAAIFDFSPLRS